jgi:hypothetical protein
MKRSLLKIIVFFGLMTMLMSGCMYTKVQRPYDRDYDETELGTKEGRASFRSVFWLVAWGDAGTRAAAENGDIKVIRHADAEYYMVLLGLYTRVTTVLYGD